MVQEKFKEFRKLFNKHKPTIVKHIEDEMSTKWEYELRSEEEFNSYELVIVYIQLTPLMDMEKLKKFMEKVVILLNKESYPYIRLSLFFFSDYEKGLIYNKVSWKKEVKIKKIEEFIDSVKKKYPDTHADNLLMIFPERNSLDYELRNHPNRNDLLIFISDSKGFKIDGSASEKLEKIKKRCFWVEIEHNREFTVKREVPYLKS